MNRLKEIVYASDYQRSVLASEPVTHPDALPGESRPTRVRHESAVISRYFIEDIVYVYPADHRGAYARKSMAKTAIFNWDGTSFTE